MAVTVVAADPVALLKGIMEKFDRHAIPGWENDGESFTLTVPEWAGKAWIRPFPQSGQLVLGLVPSEGQQMSQELYAAYHGRLIELLLLHSDGLMSSAQITAGVTYPDLMHWTGESQYAPRSE